MKKNEIVVGGKYIAKVAGKLTTVRVDEIRDVDNRFSSVAGTRYDVTNLRTGRKTTFRSAAKFRSNAEVTPAPGYNSDGSKGLLAIDAIRRGEKFEGGCVMTAPPACTIYQR